MMQMHHFCVYESAGQSRSASPRLTFLVESVIPLLRARVARDIVEAIAQTGARRFSKQYPNWKTKSKKYGVRIWDPD
jgi:hypothetical protein